MAETTDPRFDELIEWCGTVGTRQLYITQPGQVLVEQYWDGSDAAETRDIASLQKNLTAVVLTQLFEENKIYSSDSVSQYLGKGWSNAHEIDESAVQIHHLMSMNSGLDDNFEAYTVTGNDWYYNNFGYHLLRRIMELILDQTSQELFSERIFDRLGMFQSHWVERSKVRDPTGWAISGLHSTAAEVALFGQAFLAADERMITRVWRDALANSGTGLNPMYGLLWWNFGPDHGIVPGHPGGEVANPAKSFGGIQVTRRLAESAPEDMYGGMGAGDQRLYIVPSRNLIIVRLADLKGASGGLDGPFDEGFWSRFPVD